jgi:hypothetical protein
VSSNERKHFNCVYLPPVNFFSKSEMSCSWLTSGLNICTVLTSLPLMSVCRIVQVFSYLYYDVFVTVVIDVLTVIFLAYSSNRVHSLHCHGRQQCDICCSATWVEFCWHWMNSDGCLGDVWLGHFVIFYIIIPKFSHSLCNFLIFLISVFQFLLLLKSVLCYCDNM